MIERAEPNVRGGVEQWGETVQWGEVGRAGDGGQWHKDVRENQMQWTTSIGTFSVLFYVTVISYVTIGRNKGKALQEKFSSHEPHLIVPKLKEQQPREDYNFKKPK
jgi:hypothetical protein